jgi:hypothetical protein
MIIDINGRRERMLFRSLRRNRGLRRAQTFRALAAGLLAKLMRYINNRKNNIERKQYCTSATDKSAQGPHTGIIVVGGVLPASFLLVSLAVASRERESNYQTQKMKTQPKAGANVFFNVLFVFRNFDAQTAFLRL